MRRIPLRRVGKSPTAKLKQEIQATLLAIAKIKFKGECIGKKWGHICSGWKNNGEIIYQCDHLLSRSNSATFADHRLTVLVCKGLHGWKSVGSNLRKQEYDELVKSVLPKEIVKLWDRCEKEKWRVSKMDWQLELLILQKELVALQSRQVDI